ncbi:Putative F0F1-ATPase subunit Ca2+/Mg2+ transporter [Salinimicrobium sediminis]|uniref:F0F1-ATPase subunit Ca2+/Mg2+ transporter n=1 Tax=Salinimicrobium sediminis TaxID=1343891 RepID=A0A285X262_9FLAO|nr:AtpZ/AtpI family protein [Salinimicrobium sediminis]MDX1754297.1 AtpZ/AtpI family protein [Salinimicrobium sediminis]SOC79450.1 Putative F0F1-ATPase subunit Ca2+/Mg2+ transporter [Salinimicrobium sediminis]
MKEEKDNNKRSQLKNWAIFSGIAFQMGATIFVCAWIGRKLDERYPMEKNWFTIGFVLFGLVASVYVVLKQLKRYNN